MCRRASSVEGGPRLRRQGVSKILDDRGIFGSSPLHTSGIFIFMSFSDRLVARELILSDVAHFNKLPWHACIWASIVPIGQCR